MKDVNHPLRVAYVQALSGIVQQSITVPVYNQYLPPPLNPQAYIIISSISNNDVSTKQTADTSTLMRVEIHTYGDAGNSGKLADLIAGDVLNRIYATPDFNLLLSGFQIVSTQLSSDITRDWAMNDARVYIDRILTFQHNIYHKN